MNFTGQVYRHPAEANTQLLQVTAGCSHNKCSFCTMYRDTQFRVSPLSEIEADLKELKASGRAIDRWFIVNGDPFVLSTSKLVQIGELINKYFPETNTITCYTSIQNLRNKSVEDLKRLRVLGYNQLRIGLESAYDPAIAQMNKGFDSSEAYEAIGKLHDAGVEWDAIVMLGVAGKGNGEIHIQETAKLLNTYPPFMISLMSTGVTEGTPLAEMRDKGEYMECTEGEKLEEELLLLELLEKNNAYFFGGHYYNLVPVNASMMYKDEIIKHIKHRMSELDDTVLNTVKFRAGV